MQQTEGPVHYRHGDLLLQEVDSIHEAAKKLKHRILAEGTATGHHHRLEKGTVYQHEGQLYFRTPKTGSAVTHEEHLRIPIKPGIYRVDHQREYSPEEIRRVID